MRRASRQVKRNVTPITPVIPYLQYDEPELCKKNRGIHLNSSLEKQRPALTQEKAWKQLLKSQTENAALDHQSELEIALVSDEGFDPYNNYRAKLG